MKRTIYILLTLCLLTGCRQAPKPVEQPLSKLEQLHRIRPDSVMEFFDLSNDSLTKFPDLSRYVIRSLDLSHNLLDTFIAERLPLGIEKLDLSHNCFRDTLEIGGIKRNEKNELIPFRLIVIPTLVDLDLSHNSLRYLFVWGSSLRRLDVSHNDSLVNINTSLDLQYLDVSYDRNLGWLTIDPQKVDTLVQEGIDRKLEGGIVPPALRCVYRLTNPKIIDVNGDTIDVNGDTIKRSRAARDSVDEKAPCRD